MSRLHVSLLSPLCRLGLGALIVWLGGALIVSCGVPCRGQSDCPFGSYCVLDTGGGSAGGQCVSDCIDASDCEQPTSSAYRAVCTNEGQCRSEAYPPRLFLSEPEEDQVFDEGTRTIRISGEVESAAAGVSISVSASNTSGCLAGLDRTVSVVNPQAGTLTRVPFVIDGVSMDPGHTVLHVTADVEGATRVRTVGVDVSCPGCAVVALGRPVPRETTSGLELPLLAGTVAPSVPGAIWRVHSVEGDVFDGPLKVVNGSFAQSGIPLFPGTNRVEVVVSGVGTGLGEGRCSQTISSAISLEDGLRLVLTWDDGTSDLDLHVVGPGGLFGDPGTTLSARSTGGIRGGTVRDDFDGYGPETVEIPSAPSGVYGLVVEATSDGSGYGSNATLRALYRGRALTVGPLGPMHISARRGDLWVVGVVEVHDGQAELVRIDQVLSGGLAPATTPDLWLDSPF